MRIVGMILPPEEPAYICPHCGKNYKSEAAFSKHLQDKHTEDEQLEAEHLQDKHTEAEQLEAKQPEAADTEA